MVALAVDTAEHAASYVARHALEVDQVLTVAKLVAWRHPGFSAHLGDRIAAEDKQRLKDTAAYLVRSPLSLKKLVYLDGQKAVLYCSKLNPFLGRNFEAMHPLEWRPHPRPRPAPHTVLRRVRKPRPG